MIKVKCNEYFKLIEIEDSFELLIASINNSFGVSEKALTWIDQDNDEIQIDSQKDWELCRRVNPKLPVFLYQSPTPVVPTAFVPAVLGPAAPVVPMPVAAPVVQVPMPVPAPTIQVQTNTRSLNPSAPAWNTNRRQNVAMPKMNARFVKHETWDEQTYAPGTRFFKTWRMRNEGGLPWTDAKIEFVSKLTGDQMSGPDSMAIMKRVEVGEEANVTVPLIAPMREGEYTGYWKLTENDRKFGQRIRVKIHVCKPAPETEREKKILDQLEGFEHARDTALLLIRDKVEDLETMLYHLGIRQTI